MQKFILILAIFNYISSQFLDNNVTELTFLEEEKNKEEEAIFIDGTQGYLSNKKDLADFECYKMPTSDIQSMTGYLEFKSSYNFHEMITQMSAGFNIDIKLSDNTQIYPKKDPKHKDGKIGDDIPFDINIGLRFKFSDYFSESKMSSSLYYFATHSRHRQLVYNYYNEDALNDDGLVAIGNKKEFYEKCGDKLVKSVVEGAIIIVQVKINFKSEAQKKIFDGGASMGFGNFINIGADLKNTMGKLNIQGRISIEGKQRGGDPSRLSALMADNRSNECAGIVDSSSKPKDRSEALKRCMEFVHAISNYIRTDFPKQFLDRRDYSVFYPLTVTTRDLLKN